MLYMFYIMNAASIITATCDPPFVASRTNYLLLHCRPKDVLTLESYRSSCVDDVFVVC